MTWTFCSPAWARCFVATRLCGTPHRAHRASYRIPIRRPKVQVISSRALRARSSVTWTFCSPAWARCVVATRLCGTPHRAHRASYRIPIRRPKVQVISSRALRARSSITWTFCSPAWARCVVATRLCGTPHRAHRASHRIPIRRPEVQVISSRALRARSSITWTFCPPAWARCVVATRLCGTPHRAHRASHRIPIRRPKVQVISSRALTVREPRGLRLPRVYWAL